MSGPSSKTLSSAKPSEDLKRRFDYFVSGLNEPVQELSLEFSRPAKGCINIRIVNDAAQRRCVAQVSSGGTEFFGRLPCVKGEVSWEAWGLFCERLVKNYRVWSWQADYGTDVVLEVAHWSLMFRSSTPKSGLIRWSTLMNIKGFDAWPENWNLMRQSLVRLLLPLYKEGTQRAIAKDALMKFLAAKAEIRHNSPQRKAKSSHLG